MMLAHTLIRADNRIVVNVIEKIPVPVHVLNAATEIENIPVWNDLNLVCVVLFQLLFLKFRWEEMEEEERVPMLRRENERGSREEEEEEGISIRTESETEEEEEEIMVRGEPSGLVPAHNNNSKSAPSHLRVTVQS
jgi:hypothetical protein